MYFLFKRNSIKIIKLVHNAYIGMLLMLIGSIYAYEGIKPKPEKCPLGHYRNTGIRVDECTPCPPGVYGNVIGLTSSLCSAPCPKGTYNDRRGAKSIKDCKPCPAGVYGSSEGLTSMSCTAPCPYGTYSNKIGMEDSSECVDCPVGYIGQHGYRNPFKLGGYPCNKYILNDKTMYESQRYDDQSKRDEL